MDLNEYQKLAARTLPMAERSSADLLTNMCFGLIGETGETVDHVKKLIFHGHELKLADYEKELGDILWYLAGMATVVGINLNDVATTNIDKLKKRYPEGFSCESSINREEYHEKS